MSDSCGPSYEQIKDFVNNFSLSDFNDQERVSTYAKICGIHFFLASVEEDRACISTDELTRAVSSEETTPFGPKLDDLCRLHWLAMRRKAISILEFGSGFSTAVMAAASRTLHARYQHWVKEKLRFMQPFHVHSVEEDERYVEITRKRLTKGLSDFASVQHSGVDLLEVHSHIATLYSNIPNICTDFIYLDGPSQYAAKGNIRGLSLESRKECQWRPIF